MRPRYDKDGKLIGSHRMVFDGIPDNYQIKRVILKDKVPDLSYVGVMRHLRDCKVSDEFEDNRYYSSEVLSHMALDYLNSAIYLQKGIIDDRGKEIVSYYFIPCAFLCKHSIELKLKECLMLKGVKLNGHKVSVLWKEIHAPQIPQYDKLSSFIAEVDEIDSNEMALRYGISKNLEPLREKFKFNIDNFILNTMYLFNILDEFVICPYKYNNK